MRHGEHDHQAALFKWAALMTRVYPELDLLFAIPNAGKRSRATGAWMVAEGLKAGVPDVCLPVMRGGYGALWIEMKKPGNHTVSDAQKKWLENLVAQGHYACKCVGWMQAKETVVAYIEGRLTKPESDVC